MARVPGPLHTITGPAGIVVASRPWMLNSLVARRLDRGQHPREVLGYAARPSPRRSPPSRRSFPRGPAARPRRSSDGARVVPVSIRMTRSSVGGTTGRPSLQPRSNIISMSSSASATSMRRDASTDAPNRTRSTSTRSGSTLIDPQPGRITGRPSPRPATPVMRSHSGALPADGALDLDTVDDADHGRHRLDLVVPTDRRDRGRRAADGVPGKSGSSCVNTVRSSASSSCAEHRHDHPARLALALHHDDDPVRQRWCIGHADRP